MKELYGKITAALVEKGPDRIEELAALINSNINPPEKVGASDIYIRAMYIVSDRVNSAGGIFPPEEFDSLTRMLIDSPVLIGHRKDSLPIARNFHAETVQKGEEHWIKAYFYWLKNAKGAEDLKSNIDGGIYKECSISFIFTTPECTICGKDIRTCEHRPFKKYLRDGTEQEAHFLYRNIVKVLETSLVYRGAVHDTSLTGELFCPNISVENNLYPQNFRRPIIRIDSLDPLDLTHRYRVSPAYESLRVFIEKSDSGTIITTDSGKKLTGAAIDKLLKSVPLNDNGDTAEGRLIGLRGKERCPVSELIAFLNGNSSPVRRLELRLLPDSSLPSNNEICVPTREVSGTELPQAVSKYATRYGAEITDCTDGRRYFLPSSKLISMIVTACQKSGTGHLCRLRTDKHDDSGTVTAQLHTSKPHNIGDCLEIEYSAISQSGIVASPKLHDVFGDYALTDSFCHASRPSSSLTIGEINGDTICLVNSPGLSFACRIEDFNREMFESGHRFLADQIDPPCDTELKPLFKFDISDLIEQDSGIKANFSGTDTFVIRPVLLNRKNRFLIFKTSARKTHA